MPTFQVTDPETGRKVRITGDSPPNEQELTEIFASIQPEPEAPQQSVRDQVASGLSMQGEAILQRGADRRAQMDQLRQENPYLADEIENMSIPEAMAVGAGERTANLLRGVGLMEQPSEMDRANFEALRSQRPGAVGTGQVLGEAAPWVIPGAKASQVAGTGARVAASGALGATEGAIQARRSGS